MEFEWSRLNGTFPEQHDPRMFACVVLLCCASELVNSCCT